MRWHRRVKPTWQVEIQASHLTKYERVSTRVGDAVGGMYGRIESRNRILLWKMLIGKRTEICREV